MKKSNVKNWLWECLHSSFQNPKSGRAELFGPLVEYCLIWMWHMRCRNMVHVLILLKLQIFTEFIFSTAGQFQCCRFVNSDVEGFGIHNLPEAMALMQQSAFTGMYACHNIYFTALTGLSDQWHSAWNWGIIFFFFPYGPRALFGLFFFGSF